VATLGTVGYNRAMVDRQVSGTLLVCAAFVLGSSGCTSAEPKNCWPGIQVGTSHRIRIIERHAEGSAWFGRISGAGDGSSTCGSPMQYPSALELTFTVAGKKADPDHGGCLTASGPIDGVTDVTFLDAPPTQGGPGGFLFYTARWAAHGACEGSWKFYIEGNQNSMPDPFAEPVLEEPLAIYASRRFDNAGGTDCPAVRACADYYVIDLDPL
jgi:hypothetical protein